MPAQKRGYLGLVEQVGSPEWTKADNITCIRIFRGPYSTALSAAPLRGARETIDGETVYVEQSNIKPEKHGIALLTVRYSRLLTQAEQPQIPASTPLPQSTWTLQRHRIDQAIEKNPIFATLANAAPDSTNSKLLVAAKKWAEDYKATEPATELALLKAATIGDGTAAGLAKELYQCLVRGETHYAIYPPVVQQTVYGYTPLATSAGGTIETPAGPTGALPPGMTWLREGDTLEWNGQYYTLKRSWIGGPNLNTRLYP